MAKQYFEKYSTGNCCRVEFGNLSSKLLDQICKKKVDSAIGIGVRQRFSLCTTVSSTTYNWLVIT